MAIFREVGNVQSSLEIARLQGRGALSSNVAVSIPPELMLQIFLTASRLEMFCVEAPDCTTPDLHVGPAGRAIGYRL